ncbi:hypothetical protein LINGRAHAP2_LOCUS18520 [Linum grandiflorum]
MGTKVQHESYFRGMSQMRDLAEGSNSYSCLVYCGDKTLKNGHFIGTHSGRDKDFVKRTMLEHEAMFRNQLYELHRLYRIQRDLMDEAKTNSPPKSRNVNSPISSQYQNGSTLNDVEMLESRPTKVRRKMFDLRLPADEYIDTEEVKPLAKGNPYNSSNNSFNQGDVSLSGSCSTVKTSIADLNEPVTGTPDHPFRGKSSGTKFEGIWHKLHQNAIAVQMQPHLNSLRRSCDSSAQSNGIFGDRWNYNNVSTLNQKLGSERSYRNGYYHDISAGSKDLQHLTPPRSYGSMDLKAVKDVHLNVVASSNGYSNKAATGRGIEVIDLERNDDSNRSSLSWLRAIPASQHKESFLDSSRSKILGFSIFQDAHVPKKEPSYVTSIPHPSEVKVNKLLFDMNMPSDEMGIIATEEKDVKASNFRREIDLNSCISEEDEASLLPCVPDSKFTGIDLEAPIVPEVEKEAAEAIVAISVSASQDQWHGLNCSLPEEVSAGPDPLCWFADIIATHVRDNDLSESDYFESMTLKLVETKEEDYMPKPLVPEGLRLDETPARTQRGNGRRGGRQRRDFQRDILPGLVSLSRHEVTEDIQTFGGLMRATGVTWHARNSTRSGSGRGRRRSLVISPPPPPVAVACNPLIQQLNSVEAGLEDRSLRGWGKTTRRPRRQRCPPGGLPTIPVI